MFNVYVRTYTLLVTESRLELLLRVQDFYTWSLPVELLNQMCRQQQVIC